MPEERHINKNKKSRYFEIYTHIYTFPIASSNVTGSLRRDKNLKVKWELRNLDIIH